MWDSEVILTVLDNNLLRIIAPPQFPRSSVMRLTLPLQGHAYTITGLYRVNTAGAGKKERVSLVRVRNPWGDKNEWRGDWGDGDKQWDLVSDHTKKEMGLHYMYDGEFWIEFFSDFCREFEVHLV